jgi:uncharacterized protein (DUF697 family)
MSDEIIMTKKQKEKCHQIIHTSAILAASTNAGVPVPSVGIVADIVTMTAMTVGLAAVFDAQLPENAAKGIALATLKKIVLKSPIKGLLKMIPYASAAVSISIIEAAGWSIANDLAKKTKN